MNVIETRLQSLAWDAVKAGPAYGLDGDRRKGGVSLVQALAWNVGTCRSATKGEAQVGSPHKSKSTETEHRGGGVRSREDGLVMGPDRRDSIVRGCPVANRQREELHG